MVKDNSQNKKKNVPVNEIFEYQPEETLPVNDLKYIHGMLNENNEETSDSDDMEDTPSNLKATTQSNTPNTQNKTKFLLPIFDTNFGVI